MTELEQKLLAENEQLRRELETLKRKLETEIAPRVEYVDERTRRFRGVLYSKNESTGLSFLHVKFAAKSFGRGRRAVIVIVQKNVAWRGSGKRFSPADTARLEFVSIAAKNLKLTSTECKNTVPIVVVRWLNGNGGKVLSVQTLARRIRTRLHDTNQIAYDNAEILDCINCGVRFIRRSIADVCPALLMSEVEGILAAGVKSITLENRPTKIINVTAGDKVVKSEIFYTGKKIYHDFDKIYRNRNPIYG